MSARAFTTTAPFRTTQGHSANLIILGSLAAAVVALVLLGVLYGTSLSHGFGFPNPITAEEFSKLKVGMTVAQVNAVFGREEITDPNSSFCLENDPGSYVNIAFSNGLVAHLERVGLGAPASSAFQVTAQSIFIVTQLIAALTFFVGSLGCLFLAARWRGYDLSWKQILGAAAICSLIALVPWVGW